MKTKNNASPSSPIANMASSRRRFIGGMSATMAYGCIGLTGLGLAGCSGRADAANGKFPVSYSDAVWKKRLTPSQYYILRQEGTERPYSSPLDKEKRQGNFHCAGCDQALYSSKTKFDSGTGWPSFWQAMPKAVGTSTDYKIGIARTEVHCSRCGGHLGHIFGDGPKPTGKRHCINGAALTFKSA